MRRETISFSIRDIGIGSQHPITIQSMTNTDSHDVKSTLSQVEQLIAAGAQLVRIAVPDKDAVGPVAEVAQKSAVPIIADIHFDYRLAIASLHSDIDGVRINPGNIGGTERFLSVVEAAKETGKSMRIGVNSGSIEKHILEKYGHPCPEAMIESLEHYVRIAEQAQFINMVLSVKASNVKTMIAANRLAAERLPYPLHLGVTEAGSPHMGSVKSYIGIGSLLADGIGDTLRVSLTGDPLNEIPVAQDILKALNLTAGGVEIIACPTCGRTQIDLLPLLTEVEKICEDIRQPLKVAVMGCAVNGPGEAREADIGIAGGKGSGLIFRKGEVIKQVPEQALLDAFKEQLALCLEDK